MPTCEEAPDAFVQGRTYPVTESSIETGMNSANDVASRVSSYSPSRALVAVNMDHLATVICS